MTQDDWRKIEAAFQQAIALSGEPRATFLAAFARRHPELASQLVELLDADRDSDDDLQSPIAATVQKMSDETEDPWLGRTVGSWTLTERVAQGGMGTVFLARRSDEQYDKIVAIKVMGAQLVATEAIVRFKSERQILANLDHPYIAKLIDGGSTDDGVPFLVMDYVEGLPIDQHCDEQQLDIESRLRLFRKVCDAVDYAHRNLVVHRDLKPNNILVDEKANPRLLDFGIAKLLEADGYHGNAGLTRTGSRAMTPEYASPEQVRGQPVSVATDVYSLGVLLYRLMTGQSPYGTTLTTPREYEQAIVEVDPRRPSTVVTLPEADSQTPNSLGMSAQRLSRRLVGDLDNIALKSLQKDPARRYPTASALAEDVRRYMADEPVHARGDAWHYVARKFALRHARGLGVTALVVTGVVALTTYYTLRLADERDRASLAAAKAREVSAFLQSLFDSASPHTAKGQKVTAIDLLAQGVERIDALDSQPQLQAELTRIMGNSYLGLGEVSTSITMLERALATIEQAKPRDELAIAEALHNLSEAKRHFGLNEEAEKYLRRALAIRETELPPNDDRLHFTLARLGVILFDQGRVEEGLAFEEQALAGMITDGKGETSDAIDIRGNLANALGNLGRYAEAEAMHRETIALSEKIQGPLDPNTVIRMANLGLVLTRKGEYEQAVAQFEECLRRGADVWPPDKDVLAFFQGARGTALRRLGRMDDALAAYQAAERITRSGLGVESPRYLKRLRGLANVYIDTARYEEARAVLADGLTRASSIGATATRDGVLLEVLMGQLANDTQRFNEALIHLNRARSNAGRLSVIAQLELERELGEALSGLGRYQDAQPLLLNALTGMEEKISRRHKTIAPYLAGITAHYFRVGDVTTALSYGEGIADIVRLSPTPPDWTVALALVDYADALQAAGRPQARANYRTALDVLEKTFGDEDPRVVSLRAKMD